MHDTGERTSPVGRDSRLGPLIITLFGLYARGGQNWLSTASVVGLMGDLGVEGQAVRSSISRLKRRGVLQSERQAGAAGYSLAGSALETLAEGDARIFERVRAVAEDGWIVVVFSVPESEREKRHELRTSLTRLGLGTVAPGVWVAPGSLRAETRRTLERRGLAAYVDMFTGDHIAFGDLRSKVRSWWDLDELTEQYADFLRRYRTVHDTEFEIGNSPLKAFQVYIPMLTEWRRLPYRDPGLPLSLLPPGWNGVTAGRLFDELNTMLGAPAREHALAVIRTRGQSGPAADQDGVLTGTDMIAAVPRGKAIMSEQAVRPSSLINTVYGEFIRRLGGWISIADLITLLAELDVDGPAVRSAISRLKKRGTLVQERQSGTGYRLAPAMGQIFDEGDRRIFGHLQPARLQDGWVMAVFSVPESERAHRHQLRTRLTWLGFGNASPGVWLAPARQLDDARSTLRRVGLSEYVHLFTAHYDAFADLRATVGNWWDFPAIEDQYQAFTDTHRPTVERLSRLPAIDAAEAFRHYVPVLTQWRRLPYLDPGLPAELLPDDWNAVGARRVFQDLHELLREPSLDHVRQVTGLAVQPDWARSLQQPGEQALLGDHGGG